MQLKNNNTTASNQSHFWYTLITKPPTFDCLKHSLVCNSCHQLAILHYYTVSYVFGDP